MSAIRERILEYIAAFTDEKGYPPTVREIGLGVGLTSSSTVHHHLDRLRAAGRIKLNKEQPRTITIVVVEDDNQ